MQIITPLDVSDLPPFSNQRARCSRYGGGAPIRVHFDLDEGRLRCAQFGEARVDSTNPVVDLAPVALGFPRRLAPLPLRRERRVATGMAGSGSLQSESGS